MQCFFLTPHVVRGKRQKEKVKMSSKENLYNIGRILLAGSALSAAACSVEQKSGTSEPTKASVVHAQMLTEQEVSQMRNYENLMAFSSKIEPTPTFTPLPTTEPKYGQVEKIAVAQMTEAGEQLIKKYKEELPGILAKINADEQQAEDLQMYYPIYRVGQDRYGVPWELTWIIHEQESNVSRNPAAFESNIHYGAMQRAVEFHSLEDRDRANEGLEFLQVLPARHFDDAQEIILATAEIAEWAGPDKYFQRALYKYSASGPAAYRFRKFLGLEAILEK